MSAYRGSKRWILEMISSDNFLAIINSLIQDTGAILTNEDTWLPIGLKDPREAQLKNFLRDNFRPELYTEIASWWLHADTTTPNWDLISTCNIDGKRGILLVEAKAHCGELNEESHGKKLDKDASENSIRNHIRIGEAIREAKEGINRTVPGVTISRDNCYQFSNRVAHAWWLATNNIPVVLLYLGFLNAEDMNYNRRILFETPKDWKNCFTEHAAKVGVAENVHWVDCGESKFMIICESLQQEQE